MRERLIFFLSSLSRPNKQFIVILVDVTLCVIATYIAYSLRLEQVYLPLEKDFKVFLLAIVIFLPIFFYLGFYREIFRYSNLAIYFNVFKAILIYGIIFQIRKSKYCQITTIEYTNFRIVPPRKPINEPNAILNDFNKSKSDSIIAPI